MKISETGFKGLLVIEPKIFKDNRGYFFESYNEKMLKEAGIDIKFVQDNQSKSSFGVIRGLHYQLEPYAQTKLIRVLQGTIRDVVADIRKGSPTFGKWFGVEISDDNQKQLLIPRGFAHGFSVISETAVILYKCDDFYNPVSERGIIYNDTTLGINWGLNPEQTIVSEKDLKHPSFDQAEYNFTF